MAIKYSRSGRHSSELLTGAGFTSHPDRMRDAGFTLIELSIVVLVIGILLGLAVPTFLSAQNSAKAKSAESTVRTALSSVKTVYGDKQTYAIAVGTLVAAEPSLQWVGDLGAPAASSTPTQVSYNATNNVIVLATRSSSGVCYYIRDDVSTGVNAGTKFGMDRFASPSSCVADLALPPANGWFNDAAAAQW